MDQNVYAIVRKLYNCEKVINLKPLFYLTYMKYHIHGSRVNTKIRSRLEST